VLKSVPSHLLPALVLAIGVLVAACGSVVPQVDTRSPGASPGESVSAAPSTSPTFGSPPIATLAPGETSQPTTNPTVQPDATQTTATATPTVPATAPPTPTTAVPTPSPTPEHPNWPAGALEAKDAENHVGETATVCGNVVATNWLFSEPGHPTWLNINRAYPNLRFNVVIWGEQRRAWPLSGKPEVVYLDRQICVTGLISSYQTWTQIQDVEKSDIQVIE